MGGCWRGDVPLRNLYNSISSTFTSAQFTWRLNVKLVKFRYTARERKRCLMLRQVVLILTAVL